MPFDRVHCAYLVGRAGRAGQKPSLNSRSNSVAGTGQLPVSASQGGIVWKLAPARSVGH